MYPGTGPVAQNAGRCRVCDCSHPVLVVAVGVRWLHRAGVAHAWQGRTWGQPRRVGSQSTV